MGHIDNAFIRGSVNSLDVRTPDLGTKPRSHAPKYLLFFVWRASYVAQSLNKFRSNSSKWEYTYLLAEHIFHLISSHGSSVTYVCVSVKSAFVGPTKSTLKLHNALHNIAQNIFAFTYIFLQMSCSRPRLFSIGTRGCGKVSHFFVLCADRFAVS